MRLNTLSGQFVMATMATVLLVNAFLITMIVASAQKIDEHEIDSVFEKIARTYQLVQNENRAEQEKFALLSTGLEIGFLIADAPGGTLSDAATEPEAVMNLVLPGQAFYFSSLSRRVSEVLFDLSGDGLDECSRMLATQEFIEFCPHWAFFFPLENGLWFQANIEARESPVELFFNTIFISLVLTLFLVPAAVYWVARRLNRPINSLVEQSEHLGRGEYTETLHLQGPAEIRKLMKTFNRMQHRLKRYIVDRSNMLAAISHDLRTPITSLRIRAEFINDEELKGEIITSLDEMNVMITSCLAMSRDQVSDEELRDIELVEMLYGIAKDQPKTKICTNLECLKWRGRLNEIKRAIRNLVANAVKYGEQATIQLAASSSQIVITVWDEGAGVPEAAYDKIFRPFLRLDAARQTTDGSVGLGLSIAREIVRRHGGDIKPTRIDGKFGMRITMPR